MVTYILSELAIQVSLGTITPDKVIADSRRVSTGEDHDNVYQWSNVAPH